ncbi:MAG: helix-turn-helix domain-containing protein [Erythrobacter sp.]|uniref:helix-turn-helix transcriptional regulator n=1 Tax=Erythrobacter sp. TaxID=1042 RepID=UPI00261B999A|nr:helix-turn-helix domain-containing protein [Erythrobacter sp.]MDJ0977653.1 helix-turn-helix domain-containing protein [Erythrobacter sp.]
MDKLLTTKEAARILGIAPKTLRMWRLAGKGPCYLKLGATPQASVRYDHTALRAWLAERQFSSTSAVSVGTSPKPRERQLTGLNAPKTRPAKSCCGIDGPDGVQKPRSGVCPREIRRG